MWVHVCGVFCLWSVHLVFCMFPSFGKISIFNYPQVFYLNKYSRIIQHPHLSVINLSIQNFPNYGVLNVKLLPLAYLCTLCMCVSMFVCNTHTHACTHTYTLMYTHAHVHTHTHTHTHTCTHKVPQLTCEVQTLLYVTNANVCTKQHSEMSLCK